MRFEFTPACHPALLGLALAGLFSCSGAAQPVDPPRSASIDLSGYEPSFVEDFDDLDISEWGCLSRWIAHTPWGGDFGSARFMAPGDGFPFSASEGILTIEARRLDGGGWGSGIISAWDACNSGFAQKFGYFETRVRLPENPGFWPSFWLIGVDTSRGTAEVDVFEFRTQQPGRFSLGLLKHPRKAGDAKINATTFVDVAPGTLTEGYNTFGVEIEENQTVFYMNRKEIWRTETLDEFRQPMYPLLSFPADTSQMTDATGDSAVVEVDYIRAYKRKPLKF